MPRTLTLLAAAILAATCAAPHASAQTAPAKPCGLSIAFGSYAMGIDRTALARTEALLARDRAVKAIDRQRWGREGELTLCVKMRSEADARRLARKIKARVPAKPRGPVTIETRGGLSLHVPRD